jgi:putative tryptophan/tyrosine transport system substrate-binding protein
LAARGWIVLATLSFLVMPHGVEAQPAGKIPRIAVLTTSSPPGTFATDALIQGLRDLGYVDGRNINIEWRWGHGTTERFHEHAADVVRLNVDVIVASNTAAGHAARLATKTIPIVIPTMIDPVADGFVASLARPGGNITGLTFQSQELQGKRLQLLKEALPSVSRVALLVDSNERGYRAGAKEIESAASLLGIRSEPVVEVRAPTDFLAAFGTITKSGAQAVHVVSGTMVFVSRNRLAEHALKARLPMTCGGGEYVEAGCLMSYGASLGSLFRNAAQYVDRILRGARPADLPVEQPTKFELVINLRTAKALGLTIPPSLLARADKVIDP